MALNLIVAAESPLESRKNAEAKGRTTLEALCFRVLSACVEGRKDEACHDLLRSHVEMAFLYENVLFTKHEIDGVY